MSESKGRTCFYEAMFLVSQQSATDLNAVVTHIREILDRGSVRMIALKKWDERRLAFEIAKQKRGVFFLAYFECDPVNVVAIERACNLSEIILRSMVLRADHLTEEEMAASDAREELATEAALREESASEPEGVAAGQA